MTKSPASPMPWYREPWPWLLMAGPAAAIVGGIATAWIAVVHQDGLVADDYYKEGLGINRTIARYEAAARLGMAARVQFSDDGQAVRVFLSGRAETPQRLRLKLAHVTRADLDRSLVLDRTKGGWYEGRIGVLEAGRRTLLLEDEDRGWRLTGTWQPETDRALSLDAMSN
ncbi:MAG: FixH family protein [Burkholderiales bacterium]|nr:FixH family protein [Burkholderiales bacterium]